VEVLLGGPVEFNKLVLPSLELVELERLVYFVVEAAVEVGLVTITMVVSEEEVQYFLREAEVEVLEMALVDKQEDLPLHLKLVVAEELVGLEFKVVAAEELDLQQAQLDQVVMIHLQLMVELVSADC
jgi:hypothetical protein